MFKINNQLCPESLWNKFRQRYEISNYNTRNCRNLEIPKTNLEKTKKGFHYTGLQVWNSIPNEIRELPLLHQFKNNLKKVFTELENSFFLLFFKKTRFPGRTAPNHLDCMHLILFYFVYVNFLYCKLAEGISCINNCNNNNNNNNNRGLEQK